MPVHVTLTRLCVGGRAEAMKSYVFQAELVEEDHPSFGVEGNVITAIQQGISEAAGEQQPVQP